ncbi:MAG: hypothetical protein PVI01_09650 [Gemmatimonadales bacterium]|jgi:hypothetical protein
MSNRRYRGGLRILGWVTLAGGSLVLLFWVLYFSRAIDVGQADPLVHAFEAAFPVADGLFAAALFAAAYHLLRCRRPGPFFLVIAGSMSLYLGVLDTTFYIRHGVLSPLDLDSAIGLTVNALCIGGGILALRIGWRHWNAAARPRSAAEAGERGSIVGTDSLTGHPQHQAHGSHSHAQENLAEVVA